jgi:septal ring factor EnvC (AmiA/AmiB activator)
MGDRPPSQDVSQFERLEALVRALVDRHRALEDERQQLRAGVKERETRIKALDAQLVDMNQTRRDAAKRIDELITQLDQVEAEVGRRLERTVPRE